MDETLRFNNKNCFTKTNTLADTFVPDLKADLKDHSCFFWKNLNKSNSYCELYLEVNSSAYNCKEILKYSTHIPLFLEKVFDLEDDNSIKNLLGHLVNELQKSNFNNNVNNIYFNCECLFELMQKINIIKHYKILSDIKTFFEKFYNISSEIKCCIIDIDLDSIQNMKSDIFVIKKTLLLIYYVMKFNYKVNMQDTCDFKIYDLHSMKNIDFLSLLKNRKDILSIKNCLGELSCFECNIEEFFEKVNKILKVFVENLHKNAGENENIIYLIMLKFIYSVYKIASQEMRKSLTKLFLKLMSNNLSIFNCKDINRINQKNYYFLKPYYVSLKIIYLIFAINSEYYYDTYYNEDVTKGKNDFKQDIEYFILTKLFKCFVTIIKYLGDDSNSYRDNILLIFCHKRDSKSQLLYKEIFNFNKKLVSLLLDLFTSLTSKNNLNYGINLLTNNKETAYQDVFSENYSDNLNIVKEIFDYNNDTESFPFSNFDPKGYKDYFFSEHFIYISKYKVTKSFDKFISSLYKRNIENDPHKVFDKNDSILFYCISSLMNITKIIESDKYQNEVKILVNTFFEYINFFAYDDYFNSYYLLGDYFLYTYEYLFDYFPNEILDLILFCMSFLQSNNDKRLFRVIENQIDLSHLLKFLKNMINKLNNFKLNKKEYMIKILNIIIYLMRFSFFIGKSFTSQKFIKLLFKIHSAVFTNNFAFLANKNIEDLLETENIEAIYSLVVSDFDYNYKNYSFCKTHYFKYSIHIHYLKALNECLENFDGIMKINGIYNELESQVITLLKVIKNENESFFSFYNESDKHEFLRQFLKLFTNVFLCPPLLFNNLPNYFDYEKSGNFFLENLCFINLYENVNYFFIKKIGENDKDNLLENFITILHLYITDYKDKYYPLFFRDSELTLVEKFELFNFLFEDVYTINNFIYGYISILDILPRNAVKKYNANLFKFIYEYTKILSAFIEEIYFVKPFGEKDFTYFQMNSILIKELKLVIHSLEEITNIFEPLELKNCINSLLVLFCGLIKEKFFIQEGLYKGNIRDRKASTYGRLIKIFMKKINSNKDLGENKVDEDNDDSDPPEHIKLFFSEIEKLGDHSRNMINVLHIISHYYGENRSFKENLVCQNSLNSFNVIKDYNQFIENSGNYEEIMLQISLNDFLSISSYNQNLSKIITVLSNIVKYNAYKSLYQKTFKFHLESLSKIYDDGNLFNNDANFYLINMNLAFFSSILTNNIIFLNNFSKAYFNGGSACEKIQNSLKIIQFSCEFQNQLFKNLSYKTFVSITINSKICIKIKLNDLLLFNLYNLSKIYLIYNEYMKYENEIHQHKDSLGNNVNEDYDIVNTLPFIKNLNFTLKMYKSNFDTLIEIIQGTQNHIIDDFVKDREYQISNENNKSFNDCYYQEENNNFYKNYNKELFRSFLFCLNDLLVKVKCKVLSFSEVTSSDAQILQQYIFVFLNSILEQNFNNCQIVSVILSIFPALDMLNLLHSNTVDFICYYQETLDLNYDNYNKENVYIILRDIETGNLVNKLIDKLKGKTLVNNLGIEDKQLKTQLSNLQDIRQKRLIIQYFRVFKMIFLYVKIISKLYSNQNNDLISYEAIDSESVEGDLKEEEDVINRTKFIQRHKKDKKKLLTKSVRSLINWYYDKSYVQIEIFYNKFTSEKDKKILVFYPVPEDCLLISDSTKTKILDRVDRSSSISKMSSFLNSINLEVLTTEVEYFKKIQGNIIFKYYKFFNDLNLWYFELLNFAMSITLNLVLISFMDNTKLSKGDSNYNWLLKLISYFQMLYCFIYIFLWLMNRFYLSLILDLKFYDLKIDKSTTNFTKFLGKLKIILFDNLFFHNELFTFFLVFLIGIFTKISPKLNFLYGFQLIAVLNLTKTLKSIMFAIISKGKQFLLAGMLEMAIVYIFTFLGFTFLNSEFFDKEVSINEKGEEEETIFYFCREFFTCYLFNLNYGIRNGGGIGDLLSKKSFNNEREKFMSRFYFDMLYWVSVVLIMLNIVMGIVIDTFGELREKMTQEEDDKKEKCMICAKKTEYFDKLKLDFNKHIKNEHHVWDYLFFIIYISKKESSLRNSYENLVYQYFNEENYSWIPNEELLEN